MATMAYNFSPFQTKINDVEEWLKKELSLVRTSRASAAMLDNVYVETYGSSSPISHVATISMDGPRTLRIAPWDKGQMKSIEEALRKADLGLSISADEGGIRVTSPELTGERRTQMMKLVREKLEEARISVRKERESVLSDCKKKKDADEMSEDEFFKTREALQKLVDDANMKLEALSTKKEKDLEG
jgi:ribosome recycling factor